MRLAVVVAVAAAALAACTVKSGPPPDDVSRRDGPGAHDVVHVYRGDDFNGTYEFRVMCPRGAHVNGGGAGKRAGEGHFGIMNEGQTFRTEGRAGWEEQIDLGPGPLVFEVTAHCEPA
jgi:hypothetical protein